MFLTHALIFIDLPKSATEADIDSAVLDINALDDGLFNVEGVDMVMGTPLLTVRFADELAKTSVRASVERLAIYAEENGYGIGGYARETSLACMIKYTFDPDGHDIRTWLSYENFKLF